MSIEIFSGEREVDSRESQAFLQLGKELEKLEEWFIFFICFQIPEGGRPDLVVIKQNGIFIIELKYADSPIRGAINGPWEILNSKGKVIGYLNEGRENPYEQTNKYWQNLRNFFLSNEILLPTVTEMLKQWKKIKWSNRPLRSVITICPEISEGSDIKTDSKIPCISLHQLPQSLFTEGSNELKLEPDEVHKLAEYLGLQRWDDLESFVNVSSRSPARDEKKRISEIIDLKEAYEEVINDERIRKRDFIPDVLNFLDSKTVKNQILKELAEEIDSGSYYADSLIELDVPKNNFLTRLGARPHRLKDWILFHALAKYIGIKAEEKLEFSVYSTRLDLETGYLYPPIEQWKRFEEDFWKFYKEGFQYVINVDVSSYFAHINLDLLKKTILSLLGNSEEVKQIVTLLFDGILNQWAKNASFSLPQGLNASSILANVFLSEIDAHFTRKENLKYLRYVDNFRILAEEKKEIKKAMIELSQRLREIGLEPNEKKTELLPPEEVREKLQDKKTETLQMIEDILNLGNKRAIVKSALPQLEKLFEESFASSDEFKGRHLSFALWRLIRLKELLKEDKTKEIGSKLINALKESPASSYLFSLFFSVFPLDDFKGELIDFLQSEDNIYDWQEMWVLHSLLFFNSFNLNVLRFFKEKAFDRNKHSLPRSRAILLIGKFGDSFERNELRKIFSNESSLLIQRAIIVATQELEVSQRDKFYAEIRRTYPEHIELVDFLNALKKPIYVDENALPPFIPITEPFVS